MSEMTEYKGKRFRDSLKAAKVKLIGLGVAGATLIGTASAEVDINGTITPILNDMIELIPTIISLIVSIVPAIIVVAVVGFIVSFLDDILKMIHIR